MENKIADERYFLGKWRENEQEFQFAKRKITQDLSIYSFRSYWEFKSENDIIVQSRFTYTGDDCRNSTQTQPGKISINLEEMNYFVDDVLLTVKYSIVDENNFLIYTTDCIDDEPVTIKRTFNKISTDNL